MKRSRRQRGRTFDVDKMRTADNAGSRPRTIYYPIDESIELTRRDILFQPRMDYCVSSSSTAAKVVFDVEYNSTIPSTPNKIPRPSAQQSQTPGADVDRDDEAANILVLLQNAGYKDDAIDVNNDGDGSRREKGLASSSEQLRGRGGAEEALAISHNSNSVTNAIDRSPPPPDATPTVLSSEMTRLRQELEMMRSERDLAVIELKHRKPKFEQHLLTEQHVELGLHLSNMATKRNNDLELLEIVDATSRGDEVLNNEEVLMLRTENEESKRKLLEASIRITALSAEKITLVTMINDALNEARSTIAAAAAALNCNITNFNDINGTITDNSSNNNNAQTVSFEETGHHLPPIAATRQDERVLPPITTINDHIDPPRPRIGSNDTCPTTKSARFSSSSSCSSHGSGRVSFDRSTSFGNTKLPKFDIFNENFSSSRNNKKKNTKLLSFGHKEDGSGDFQSNGGLVNTQSSTRRKKYSASNTKGNSNSYSLDSFDDNKLY